MSLVDWPAQESPAPAQSFFAPLAMPKHISEPAVWTAGAAWAEATAIAATASAPRRVEPATDLSEGFCL